MCGTLTLVLLLAGCCFAQRIVGGEDTTVEQYPSIVQVEYFRNIQSGIWRQECGANILNNLYVLSAAHCFHWTGNLNYLREHTRIRAGATRRNAGGIVVNIVREFNHPSYWQEPSVKDLDGDISVVRLASPLSFGPTIQPTSIPSQNSVVPDNVSVVHAGWGMLEFFGPSPEVLQHVQVYTINNDICRERYREQQGQFIPRIITRNMICAGVLDVGGRDGLRHPCMMDSGGPMFFGGVTVGIISFGNGCGHSFYPAVSAAVAPYTNWIEEMASQ